MRRGWQVGEGGHNERAAGACTCAMGRSDSATSSMLRAPAPWELQPRRRASGREVRLATRSLPVQTPPKSGQRMRGMALGACRGQRVSAQSCAPSRPPKANASAAHISQHRFSRLYAPPLAAWALFWGHCTHACCCVCWVVVGGARGRAFLGSRSAHCPIMHDVEGRRGARGTCASSGSITGWLAGFTAPRCEAGAPGRLSRPGRSRKEWATAAAKCERAQDHASASAALHMGLIKVRVLPPPSVPAKFEE